jgi:hypothetical protein
VFGIRVTFLYLLLDVSCPTDLGRSKFFCGMFCLLTVLDVIIISSSIGAGKQSPKSCKQQQLGEQTTEQYV